MNAYAMMADKQDPRRVDRDVLRLLTHRYGDGLVYLRNEAERRALAQAERLGLVNSEGCLTPAGRSAVAGYEGE